MLYVELLNQLFFLLTRFSLLQLDNNYVSAIITLPRFLEQKEKYNIHEWIRLQISSLYALHTFVAARAFKGTGIQQSP